MKLRSGFYSVLLVLMSCLLVGCYHQKTRSFVQLPDSIQEAQISHHLHTNFDSIAKQGGDTSSYWGGEKHVSTRLTFVLSIIIRKALTL